MNLKSSSTLPPLIHEILQERRNYHSRFVYIVSAITCLSFAVLIETIRSLFGEEIGLQIFLDVILFSLFSLCVYYAFYHFRQKEMLDKSLYKGHFSVVKGRLEFIECLSRKRVRYIIDGQTFEGVLVIPGFIAFQTFKFKDVVFKPNELIELYVLPKGLIAGAIYPEYNKPIIRREANTEDWQIVSHRQWKGVRAFVGVAIFWLIIILGTLGFVEYTEGTASWELFGYMCAVFSAVILLLFSIHVLLNLSQICVLMNKQHPSVEVKTYQGIAVEWYLSETWYRNKIAKDGWIRLSGGLHKVQSNLSSVDKNFLDPLRKPIRIEYLIYKGRLIYLRSDEDN